MPLSRLSERLSQRCADLTEIETTLRGAYRAIDDRHVVHSPCLASRK